MLVIPVLDLLDGVVVRGVAGERDTYKPIRSRLVNSSDPLQVANAIRRQFGLTTFYVADLDAITGSELNVHTINSLIEAEFDLLLDAGTGTVDQIDALSRMIDVENLSGVILGLESITSPEELANIMEQFGDLPLTFSLDLMNGDLITCGGPWNGMTPRSTLDLVLRLGFESVILLDLANVGMGTGNSCLSLCDYVKQRSPDTKVITGGGVRSDADLAELESHGCNGALVASALHDGRLEVRS